MYLKALVDILFLRVRPKTNNDTQKTNESPNTNMIRSKKIQIIRNQQ